MSGNLFVTGVAGFIGSRVAEFLIAEGNMVIGIDNLNDLLRCHLKKHRLQEYPESEGGFQFIRLISSRRNLRNCLRNIPF